MKIGVFDSGIGGRAVADRLQEILPEAEIICVNDHEHVPYGNRTPAEILQLTDTAIQPLLHAQCDAIVIACNSATTIAISHLRASYPTMRFVGLEPMIKPAAALSKSGTIAVLATPATLASSSYHHLKNTWASTMTVIEPDVSTWASQIESGASSGIDVEAMVQQLVDQDVDVIVLACTHYHWLKTRATAAAGSQATILEPSDAIGNRIIDLLHTNRDTRTVTGFQRQQ